MIEGEGKEKRKGERISKDETIQSKPNSHHQARFVLPKGYLRKIWKVWYPSVISV